MAGEFCTCGFVFYIFVVSLMHGQSNAGIRFFGLRLFIVNQI
jgi:hypothetical protein